MENASVYARDRYKYGKTSHLAPHRRIWSGLVYGIAP